MSRTSLGSTIPDFADAQGNLLDIEDHKTVLLELPNAAGDLQCFRESCLVSSVSSPLFAWASCTSLDGVASGKITGFT